MSNLTVATFRAWKGNATEPTDAVIQAAIDAAEEAINDHCGRIFAVASGSSARSFAPAAPGSTLLFIPDCTTVTSVTEYGTEVDSSSYQLEPVNGRTSAGTTSPYTAIRRYGTPWLWDFGFARISVTATWGWAALPARYTEATKILTADVLDQKNLQNGVLGFTDYAGIRVKANPMVSSLLIRLVRTENTVGIA